MKFGTRTTWNGMIRVTSRSANNGSRNRKWSAEKANAAIEQLISWPTVFRPAILNELMKKVANGSDDHMSG